MIDTFDDLRPYYDSEIPSAMQRIADSPLLSDMASYIFPEKTTHEIRKILRKINTIDEFQVQVMYHFNKSVIRNSIRHLTFSGMSGLIPEKRYLFISNHRDIVLDSSLLAFLLYENQYRTPEITFGSNLMTSQLMIDIGKANKMFKVIRGGTIRDFYKNSMRLSAYVRYTITQKKESVWIAQRNGRTKDGNDITDQGIIKMFSLSGSTGIVNALDQLNIVPVAISYEIEPCDVLKTREIYLSRNGKKYTKQTGEDLNSILTGILQQKGNVHINICKPLKREELDHIAEKYPGKIYKKVSSLIDKRIYSKYKLHANNFIAHDIRSGKKRYKLFYDADEKECFTKRKEQMLQQVDGDKEILQSIFLGIYANPVDHSTSVIQKKEKEFATNKK